MSGKVQGRVNWFSVSRGYGFITREDDGQDIFVHQSDLHAEGFRSLGDGEVVEFNVEAVGDGRLKAVDVSGPSGAFVQGAPRRPYRNRGGEGGGKGGGRGEGGSEGGPKGRGRGGGRGGGRGRKGGKGVLGDPLVPVTNQEIYENISKFYGLKPELRFTQGLLTRNMDAEKPRRLFYCSESVCALLKANESAAAGQQLNAVSIGLKAFEKQDNRDPNLACSYRCSQDALRYLLPFMERQRAAVTLEEYRYLLHFRNLSLDPGWAPKAMTVEASVAAVHEQAGGCVVIAPHIEPGDVPGVVSPDDLAIACWKGKTSVGVLITKLEGENLLQRLGGSEGIPEMPDPHPYAEEAKRKREEQEAAEAAVKGEEGAGEEPAGEPREAEPKAE